MLYFKNFKNAYWHGKIIKCNNGWSWSGFCSWILVRYWGWNLVMVLRLNLGQDLEAKIWLTFIEAEDFETAFWSICATTKKQFLWWKHSTHGSVVRLTMFSINDQNTATDAWPLLKCNENLASVSWSIFMFQVQIRNFKFISTCTYPLKTLVSKSIFHLSSSKRKAKREWWNVGNIGIWKVFANF